MIVTCHSCQTRFRVADEKIGPKGARVRCSRCKTVFAVRPARPDDPFARAAAARDETTTPARTVTPPASGGPSPETPAPEAAAPAAPPPVPAERTIPDLALEETQRPASVVRPAPEPTVASRDPGLLEFGDVDLSGPDPFGEARRDAFAGGPWSEPAPSPSQAEDPLAGLDLGNLGAPEPAAPASQLPPPVEAPPLLAPPAPSGERTVTQGPPPRAPDAEQDASADAEQSRKRLKSVGFNALSLVALLVLAVVLFQVWKGRQQDRGRVGAGPAVATAVSSTPYVTASGKTVVVVRGRVKAAEPMRKVTVRAELLDGGQPVAYGTATAGAAATVEEIHGIASSADADALARSVAVRAPAAISAGEELPFTAVIADAPANLRAVDVRVSLQPER